MTDNPETASEVSPKDAKYWLDEIKAAKDRNEGWCKKADEAEKRYRAEDDKGEALEFGALNLLFANVETQKAAIGEDFGKIQVTRVNQPENDGGLARHVSLVWERTLAAAVRDTNDNHDIALAVGDIFVPGRGQTWLEVEKEDNGWVRAPIVRVMYTDFLHGPATRWGSVPWGARMHTFTRDELVSECRMEKEKAAKVPLNIKLPASKKDAEVGEKGQKQFKRAAVWEIWTTYPKKARLYVAEGFTDEVLRYNADPLKLKKFFPFPRPLQPNGDESKPPLTDYSRYQNQAEELDRICQRIFSLTEQVRRVGVHDKALPELADLARQEDGTSLPVENWADLQMKGGLNKVQEWLDLTPIVVTLQALHEQRDTLIRLIYELSGISDLARGQTDPDETLGAQQLKQTFGSSRFKRREKESRRFAAEAYGLKGEVVAELFSREQMEEMSGITLPLRRDIDGAKQSLGIIQQQQQEYAQIAQQAQQAGQQPPPPPEPLDQEAMASLTKLASTKWSWEDVSGVLRSDSRRCYSVEVETDQSNFVDPASDQQQRTQFFQVVTQALAQIAPAISQNPKSGEVFKDLVMWVIGAFKSGRAQEDNIEHVIDEFIEKPKQAGQEQPPMDPKMQADIEIAKSRVEQEKVQLEIAKVHLATAQAEAHVSGGGMQNDAMTAQLKAQESAAKAQASVTASQAKAQDAQTKSVQEAQKIEQQHMANEAKRVGHQVDMVNKEEKLEFDRKARATAEEALLSGPTQKSKDAA